MKIGVSGFNQDLVGIVDFFEIDAFDLEGLSSAISRSSKVVVSANHYYFSQQDPEIFRDRIEELAEKANRSSALFCLLKLPPSFFENHSLRNTIKAFLNCWIQFSAVDILIDLPQKIPNIEEEGFDFSRDPMWDKPKKVRCWKVHGWHAERWIRLYSSDSLKELKKNMIRYQPDFLIFGHSQRMQQVRSFLDLA